MELLHQGASLRATLPSPLRFLLAILARDPIQDPTTNVEELVPLPGVAQRALPAGPRQRRGRQPEGQTQVVIGVDPAGFNHERSVHRMSSETRSHAGYPNRPWSACVRLRIILSPRFFR